MTGEYYLGLDLSTQALKCAVVDHLLCPVCEVSVNYAHDLPHYGTTEGFHRTGDVVTSPVAMWLEALDLVLERAAERVDLRKVAGVGGCGQQHGTVYTGPGFHDTLQHLNPSLSLQKQLQPLLALQDSPIWLDSSTEQYCARMESEFKGAGVLSARTGSRAHCRFSAHQIHKVFCEQRAKYDATQRILLVSNFLCSLLAGSYVTPDYSDASGMNLLDIFSKTWIKELATLYGVDVTDKIGDPGSVLEASELHISSYFVKKYGFEESCRVARFTGDNPATLVGLQLGGGDVVLSLGTSDVIIGVADNVTASADTHVFCNPLNDANHMFIICYKNGGLVREELKDSHCNGSWDQFNSLLTAAPINPLLVGNYFPQTEIIPAGLRGVICSGGGAPLLERSAGTVVRTVTEGQFLSKANHLAATGFKWTPESKLIVAGGASVNRALLTLISNIMGMDVYRSRSTNTAALGGAYLGYISVNGQDALTRVVSAPAQEAAVPDLELVCKVDEAAASVYMGMRERYAELQCQAVQQLDTRRDS